MTLDRIATVASVGSQPAAWNTTLSVAPGAVTTLAGSGSLGSVDGTGTAATFTGPSGMSVAGGFGYVLDTARVRKVSLSTGQVTSIVGNGTPQCTDSTTPSAVQVGYGSSPVNDGTNLYWLDPCTGGSAFRIRKMALSTLAVSTLATSTPALSSLTVGAGGVLYAAAGTTLVKIDTGTGVVTTVTSLVAPSGAQLTSVVAMAADPTNVWVVASGGCTTSTTSGCTGLYKVNAVGGTAALVTGSWLPSSNGAAFAGPLVSAGSYLYALVSGSVLMRVTKADLSMALVAGTLASYSGFADGTGANAWLRVSGVDTDGSALWFSDPDNARIRKIVPAAALPSGQPAAWTASVNINPVVGSVVADSTKGYTGGVGLSIAGGFGYAITGGKVVKVNLATGVTTTAAGTGTEACVDSVNPASASLRSQSWPYLVNDGSFLYWPDRCSSLSVLPSTIRRMSLTTGAVSTLTNQAFMGLTVGPDGSLYAGGGNGSNYSVSRVSTVTGNATQIAVLPNPTNGYWTEVAGMAADATSVYVTMTSRSTNSCPAFGNAACGSIFKVDIASGAVTTLYAQARAIDAMPMGALVSAGGTLYAAMQMLGNNPNGGLPLGLGVRVFSFSKTTGQARPLGDAYTGNANVSGSDVTALNGLDVSGGALYVLDAARVIKFVQGPAYGPSNSVQVTNGSASPSEWVGSGNATEVVQQVSAAEPVDLASGAFWSSHTDIAVPGRGVPLSFTRSYDTRRAATAGRLGFGWTDNWDWNLSVSTTTTGPTVGQVTIRQDNGSQTVFTPNGVGGYYAPSRVLASLTKNADGTWTYVVRSSVTYTFDATGRLTSVKDRYGYVTSLAYDASNRLSTVTDPAGRTLTLAYDASNRVSTVTDPLPRTVTYTYDTAGNLATVTDVDAKVTTYGYDTSHRLTTDKDPRANTLTTAYDATSGKVSTQTDRRGKITTFAYTAPAADGSTTTTVTHPRGNKDVYTFLNGLNTTLVRGSGTVDAATSTYTYDPVTSAVASVTDPLGHVTTSTYDAQGNALTTTDALGRTTTATYNAFNEPLTSTDPLGVTTTNTYDTRGNLLTVSRPLTGTSPLQTATITYTYGDATHPGDVTSVTDAIGKVTGYAYDTYGNRKSVTDPTGRTTTSTFNAIGWTLTTVTPAGNATGGTATAHTVTYGPFTGFGAALNVKDQLGKTTLYKYDADQNVTDVTDPDGRHTNYGYNANNQRNATTRPDGTKQTSTYDDNGNLATQVDGLTHTTSYGYDNLDRPMSVTDALARVTTTTYDAAGNVKTTVAPAATGTGTVTTTRTYNNANQLTGITYSDGVTPAASFTYDGAGRLATMTDGTGTTTYTLDSLNRTTKIVNGAGQAVSYTYDLAGHDLSIVYPGTTGTVTRGYDAAGRLTSVKDWMTNTTTFGYDGDGNWASTTYPNGVTGTRGYDNADRLTSVGYAKGTTALGTFTYTRTAAGLLATTTPSGGAPGASDTYSYTTNGQLQSTLGATSTSKWVYDAADRVTTLPTGATLAYDNADELTTLTPTTGSATTYTYDRRGNRATAKIGTAAAAAYTWDQANRLTAYTTPAGAKTTYTYDATGLRASKTPAGTTTKQNYAWDRITGTYALLLTDATTNYIYGPGGVPIEQVRGTTPTYLHGDQLDSTRLITTGAGTVADTYSYDPYGNTTTHTGATNTSLTYNGQYLDAESGLLYLRARYYDPANAQFTSVDVLASTTRARYNYAGGNPLYYRDPSGLEFCIGSMHCIATSIASASAAFQTGSDLAALGALVIPGAEETAPIFWGVGQTAGIVNTVATCADPLTGDPEAATWGDCGQNFAANALLFGFQRLIAPGREVAGGAVRIYDAAESWATTVSNLFGDLWSWESGLDFGSATARVENLGAPNECNPKTGV